MAKSKTLNNNEKMTIKFDRKTANLLTRLFLLAVFINQASADSEDLQRVVIQTGLGDITVEINQQKAPASAANFLRYVDENRYKSASFYRTVRLNNQPDSDIRIEVIQGGIGFVESDLRLDPIQHETTEETGMRHQDGAFSMARLEPGTASSEFFICIGDQPELDFGGKRNPDGQGFAVLGYVVSGMEIVKEIQTQPDAQQMIISPIPIISIERVDTGEITVN